MGGNMGGNMGGGPGVAAQQQQGNSGGGTGFGGLNPSNPMAAAGLNMGRTFIENNVRNYIPGLTAFWDSLHYYFDVNNKFVANRIKCVLFPITHPNWRRARADEGGLDAHTSKYLPPRGDMNAPDLYIPLMSFITFVLVTGLLKGTRMSFTPEVLGDVVTASIVTQVLEIGLLKAGMWFTKVPSVPVLDLVAYTGYKYLGLTINTVMGILAGALVYYVVLLFTGAAMAYFMLQTMKEAVDVHGGVQTPPLALGAAVLQVVAMWWLGYSGEL